MSNFQQKSSSLVAETRNFYHISSTDSYLLLCYHILIPMMRNRSRFGPFLAALVLLLLASTVNAQEGDRAQIPEKYTWDLTHLYPTTVAWRSAKDALQAKIPDLGGFKGQLATSAETLADALDRMYTLDKELARLAGYASMLADQDTRDSEHQGMRQEIQQLRAAFRAEVSYLRPEILRIDTVRLQTFLASEPRLSVYRFFIENVVRRRAHALDDAEEKILADVGPLSTSASSIFRILSNADLPYPTVTLGDGRTARLDQSAYTELRALPDRSDRQKVMFFAKTRNYTSALEATLDWPNIPASVYMRLIEGVNRHLATFHRYLKLRKRMMGVDQLHYYDLYAPLVGSVQLRYTPEDAQALVLAAVEPLGLDYAAVVGRSFRDRWIDWYPAEGKWAGGYSTGAAYDVHPYILLNYNGQYADVSTLAHELGHLMHSYYTNKTQPYALKAYPIFVAEVASTFNEVLLMDHMLKNIRDRDTRLALLGNYLEKVRTTVFRQTLFAEFELGMHEMAWRGEPVTGEALSSLYLNITRRYYGHDQGVSIVDDYVAHEWSYVPHFYSEFYVFQYATSFSASIALAQKAKASGPAGVEATKRFLAFLASGGSKYPIDLLKDAGVDMTTDEPLELTMREMNRVMDEMETLLAP